MPKKTCYYCGVEATSKEHVPPKCLFPEQRDTGGVDFRKNLLTVPSCDVHNSATSCDDEFLLACLAPIAGNNLAGFVHTQTKLRRAMQHTSGHLQDIAMRQPQVIVRTDDNGKKIPLLVGIPNVARLDQCFDKIVRAIWYLENGRAPFNGGTRFLHGFLVDGGSKIHIDDAVATVGSKLEYLKYLARVKLKEEFAHIPIKGSNPDIFRYQVGPPDENSITPMLLTFYGNADVMCSLIPSDAPPRQDTLDAVLNGTQIKLTINDSTEAERNVTIRWSGDEN